MSDVLTAFRTGRRSFSGDACSGRVIDKILFAATKADHLHHTSHDRLEAILRHLTGRAIARAESVGARDRRDRARRRARDARSAVKHGRETLDAIVGTPIAGESIDDETFDGETRSRDLSRRIAGRSASGFPRRGACHCRPREADYRFVRFRPPVAETGVDGRTLALPHIRLDRALEFLLGDELA